MKVLLLTIAPKKTQKMIRDIANEFVKNGHAVFIVCPADADNKSRGRFVLIDGIRYLFVNSGNTAGKINLIKKVSNFVLVDSIFKKALKKAMPGIAVDLLVYATPPITLVNTIAFVKETYHAHTYLMLKDNFPQNAVDMGMIKKNGVMGIIWRFFRNKEKRLYHISDSIGCMSPANCRYVLENNPEIRPDKVGICVNSYVEEPLLKIDRETVRNEFGLPQNAIIFLYGGNLGKPQGLGYLVDVLKKNANKTDRYFLVCGGGNDQQRIIDYIESEKPRNVQFMHTIPADDFDRLSRACDVGMVFLDHRFTIPNFPSRMLSIMLNEMPILAATDKNTDVGETIADGDMGWWCESTDTAPFCEYIDEICSHPDLIAEKGKNARYYFESHYTSQITYSQIIDGINHKSNQGTSNE